MALPAERQTELGSLKKRNTTTAVAPSNKKDGVALYQELNKLKSGLPKALVTEFDKRKVRTVEEAAKVASALRSKRIASHKISNNNKKRDTAKRKQALKPAELTRPGGKSTRNTIDTMKRAINSGIVKL
ncbi:hypothetical protein BgAZ_206290 [Babesia gibsoni]|uniref:Uncharacterized protein n=1 Tax=Babesia gibsoni TaxID=33632 RepID=A0AAD8LQD4_BABGI|nr:hypothetical protein BgAZ_206290 [Babesia gibsoni]